MERPPTHPPLRRAKKQEKKGESHSGCLHMRQLSGIVSDNNKMMADLQPQARCTMLSLMSHTSRPLPHDQSPHNVAASN